MRGEGSCDGSCRRKKRDEVITRGAEGERGKEAGRKEGGKDKSKKRDV